MIAMTVAQAYTVMVGLAVALVVSFVVMYYGLIRLKAIREQTAELSEEHERLFLHVQYRQAAQRFHGLANEASGDQRRELLTQAAELYRDAIRTRRADDETTYAELRAVCNLVEAELAACPEGEADPTANQPPAE